MRRLAEVVLRLHAENRFDAIGALGGTGGTALATHAMQRLPIGLPKLMVSTAASGAVALRPSFLPICNLPDASSPQTFVYLHFFLSIKKREGTPSNPPFCPQHPPTPLPSRSQRRCTHRRPPNLLPLRS